MHHFLLLRGNIQINRQILTRCAMVGEIVVSQRLHANLQNLRIGYLLTDETLQMLLMLWTLRWEDDHGLSR